MVSRSPARLRVRFRALLVLLWIVSFAHGQNNPLINLVNNPNIGVTTQILNPLDAFTGTLTVGTVGQTFGTLSLSGNYTTLLPIVLTGNQSTLNNSGGTFTLVLASTGSLTRTGSGAGTYSTVFANLNNQGNIVVNQGTLFVNGNLTSNGNLAVSNGATLTAQNTSVFANTGTANVTGAGSVLTVLNPINTGGTIISDSSGLLQLGGNFITGNLGTINLTNSGTVEITGNLDNSGATLVAPIGGAYTLNAGTIKNGTVVETAFNVKSGTLDGATVNGNLTLGTNSLILKNGAGATVTTTVGTSGQTFGTLSLGSNLPTLAGSSLVLTGNQSLVNNSGGAFTLTVVPTSSLTRTGSIAGTYSTFAPNLVNQGNIVVNQGTLFLNGTLANSGNVTVSNGAALTAQNISTFTNTGTANVTGAGSVLTVLSLINTGGTIISDSSGLLQLGGNFVTGNLGTINLTNGGTVEITGNLDNSGATLVAPNGGGYVLSSGTIKNGNVVDTAFSPKTGTLDGALVQGNITLGTNSIILKNNAGANLTTTVGTSGQTFGTLSLGSNVSTIAGSSLMLTGNQSQVNNSGGAFTLTVVPTSSLTRTGSIAGTYSTFAPNLVNQGNIVVNQGTLYLNGTLANSGNLTVSNGAALTSQSISTFTNTGTANVTGAGSILTALSPINTGGTIISDSSGLLQLGGNFVTGNLGTINLTNSGTVEITGNLDNSGATLVAPVGGAYTLNTGTIKNGTVVETAFNLKSGTLDGAIVNGNLTLGTNSLILKNGAGATITTTVGTSGQTFGTLSLGSNLPTLAGSSLVLTGNQSLVNNSGGAFTLTVVPNSSLTRTGSIAGTYSAFAPNLVNQGNIVVNQGTLFLNGTLANSGTVTVSNGAALTSQSISTFTNTGTANVTGAGSVLMVLNVANTGSITANLAGDVQFAGNFTTAGLGSVDLSNGGIAEILGNLTNTAATLAAPTGGAFTLTGIITGGNIVDTALIEKSGVLDGATVQGNLTIAGGASPQSLTLRNGATFSGTATLGTAGQNGGTLFLGSPLTLAANSNLTVTGLSSNINYNNGQTTLTVAPNSSLLRTGTGTTQIQDHLVNQGTVTVNGGTLNAQDVANSSNISVAVGTSLSAATGLTQTAGTLKVDGSLFPSTNPGLIVQGGSVTGAGNIQGTTTFSGGTLDPGGTIGTLTFTGNLTLMGGATTLLELGAGTNINDKVVVIAGNTLVFGGALDIVTTSTVFASGQSWNLFSFTNHSGNFASFTLPNTNNGWVWDTSQLTTNGVLTLTTFVPLPVPEPSIYALLAAGLGVMLVAHRRRHAALRSVPRDRTSL